MRAFAKYFCFSGRASRSEYWWFVLFHCAVLICIGFLVGLMADPVTILAGNLLNALIFGWELIVLFPSLCLCCRRLHDIGKSGWWFLVTFVPFVGGIICLIWMCKPSDPWVNDYGDVPNLAESMKQ